MLLAVRPHTTGPLPAAPPPAALPRTPAEHVFGHVPADLDPAAPPGVEAAPDFVNTRRLDREARHLFRVREGLDYDRRTEDGWTRMFGADGFTFDDIIDVINPLQHLPIVSAIYRRLTGDTISQAARMAGAALFGGPLGFAAAIANLAIEEASGRDLGDHAMAMLLGDEAADGPTDVAAAAGPGLSLLPPPAPTVAAVMEQGIDRYRKPLQRAGAGFDPGGPDRRSVDRSA